MNPPKNPAVQARAGERIGLLGGSFNPAHTGHAHISRTALDQLGLDQVWWLVSPQNPLKSEDDMAPLAARMAAARKLADDPRIHVTDIERELGTRYTVDTLAALRARFPGVKFVWLMGADILIQMPKWKAWRAMFRAVPIAVFPRAPYSMRALTGKVAKRFQRDRIRMTRARTLADMRPPAWVFMRAERTPESATRIRAHLSGLAGTHSETASDS